MSPHRLWTSALYTDLVVVAASIFVPACGAEGEGGNGAGVGSAGVSVLAQDAGTLMEFASVELTATNVATAALEADGATEVIAAGESLSLLQWRANAFSVYDELDDFDPRLVAGGNIIDSTLPDVAALGSSGLVVVPVDAEGNFNVSLRADLAIDACWMALMDFDGDDDLDVVTAGTQLLLHEARPGGLQAPVVMSEVDGPCHPQRFAVADINSDDRPDVVYGIEQRVNLVLNNRTAWSSDQFAVESTVAALVAGDLDGDFDDDLLISNGAGSLEVVVRVQGILFESAQQHDLPHGPLHLVDLQGDQDVDLLTVGDGTVVVYSDLGSDSPQTLAELAFPAARAALGLTSGDIDGDGDVDVILSHDAFEPGD